MSSERIIGVGLAAALTLAGCGDDGGASDTSTGMDTSVGMDSRPPDTSTGGCVGGPSCAACPDPTCTLETVCVGGGWECNCRCVDAATDADVGTDGAADAAIDADVGAADAASDTSASDGATCGTAQRDAADFLAANKACSIDADCVTAPSPCFIREEACCTVYMTDGYDTTAWTALLDRMSTCVGGACACCRALPPPPACNMSVCGPGSGRP